MARRGPGPRGGGGCGSENGYHAHLRKRTVPCTGCLNAHTAYAQDRKRAGRCAPGLGWPLLPAKAGCA